MFQNQFINLLWETTEVHSSLCGQHILAPRAGLPGELDHIYKVGKWAWIWWIRHLIKAGQGSVTWHLTAGMVVHVTSWGKYKSFDGSSFSFLLSELQTHHISAHHVYDLLPSGWKGDLSVLAKGSPSTSALDPIPSSLFRNLILSPSDTKDRAVGVSHPGASSEGCSICRKLKSGNKASTELVCFLLSPWIAILNALSSNSLPPAPEADGCIALLMCHCSPLPDTPVQSPSPSEPDSYPSRSACSFLFSLKKNPP